MLVIASVFADVAQINLFPAPGAVGQPRANADGFALHCRGRVADDTLDEDLVCQDEDVADSGDWVALRGGKPSD